MSEELQGIDTELQINDLHMFQRDCLRHISLNGPCKGTTLVKTLSSEYNENINHSRVYPCLDELTEMGIVNKGRMDDRTNKYTLTEKGQLLVEYFRDAWEDAA